MGTALSNTNLHNKLLADIEKGLQEMELPDAPTTLYQPYRYALEMGGKRVRPLLALLANGLCGGNPKNALPAALAVEVLHNFTLVHDDIMDRANTRRGMESVFKKWNQNVAILSGDVMFADASKQLSYYGEDSAYSKQEFADIHQAFIHATITVCEGQALDMEFVDRKEIALEEYLKMIAGKTAALLSGSLEMGAISAHASKHEREILTKLGYEMGVAFQIQDDLLDAIADPEKFGKRPGGDIFEGKKTYLTILALERADGEQKHFIQQVLDDPEPATTQVQQVLSLMKALQVLDDVKNLCSRHYKKAEQLLEEFDSSEYKDEFQHLLSFLKNRDH